MNSLARHPSLKTIGLSLCIAGTLPLFGSLALAQDGNSEADNRAASLIITLAHRSPLDAMERLQPLLDPRGDIGRIADKLIINTTAGNLTELEAVIAEFDIPPRRLVLSVDPSYNLEIGSDSNDSQSTQALEFEENVFFLPTQPLDFVSADPADFNSNSQSMRSIRIETEISGNVAMADIATTGFASLSPNYQISLPLGQWIVLEPVAPTLTPSEAATATEDSTPANGSETERSVATESSTDDTVSIAVRVDVLP